MGKGVKKSRMGLALSPQLQWVLGVTLNKNPLVAMNQSGGISPGFNQRSRGDSRGSGGYQGKMQDVKNC